MKMGNLFTKLVQLALEYSTVKLPITVAVYCHNEHKEDK